MAEATDGVGIDIEVTPGLGRFAAGVGVAACELLGVGFFNEFGFDEFVEAGVGNRDGEGDKDGVGVADAVGVDVGIGTDTTAEVVT